MGLPSSDELVARAFELHAKGNDKDAVITLLFSVFTRTAEVAPPTPPAKDANNQAPGGTKLWQNLRFRSAAEVSIAEALDRRGVLFLPNCIARVGVPDQRFNREADFLVFYQGRWGILEVGGEPFHPPTRTAEDHERDRTLKVHGIAICEHFDAAQCVRDPDGVVRRFLEILARQ